MEWGCCWLRIAEQLGGTVGLLLCPSDAVGWAPWLSGVSVRLARRLGLAAILSSRWGYEFASLLLGESKRA